MVPAHRAGRVAGLALLLLASGACRRERAAAPPPSPAQPAAGAAGALSPAKLRQQVATLLTPLVPPAPLGPGSREAALVELGRMLYHDTRLSKGQDLSCASCHSLERFGAERRSVSEGHRGQLGTRNAPTVYNAANFVAQFWDGRAHDLEEQAKGPILNPIEMAMPSERQVVATLASIPGYRERFRAAFPDARNPITFDNVARAIGAFERRLVTPGRFDRFLAGDDHALSADETRGLDLFVRTGCTTCHSGAAVGGGSFQKLGLVVPYPDEKDLGRYLVTKDEADRMKFRVPTLRNVAETGPYLHDGSVKTLEETVSLMARHQLSKNLSPEDVKALVAFLRALTGALPAYALEEPTLPPPGPRTPKPDPS